MLTFQKMMLVKAVKLSGEEIPYTCVVYSRDDDSENDNNEVTLPHGNDRKSHTPYLRTSRAVFHELDSNMNMNASDNFYQTLEKVNPLLTTSPSQEPRNIKQVRNRKHRKENVDKITNEYSRKKDDLQLLLDCQRDEGSPVQTVVVSGDHYFVFVYTKRQIDDIRNFCCQIDDDSSVLGIDTTFKLCSMWLTDTSYRNKRLHRVRLVTTNLIHYNFNLIIL